jgi:uncharacterized protein with GYD domain
MSIFLTQGRFTREYIKGGLARAEDRHAAIARLCEQAGGKLVHLYFTLGEHDFLVVSDMPDTRRGKEDRDRRAYPSRPI